MHNTYFKMHKNMVISKLIKWRTYTIILSLLQRVVSISILLHLANYCGWRLLLCSICRAIMTYFLSYIIGSGVHGDVTDSQSIVLFGCA